MDQGGFHQRRQRFDGASARVGGWARSWRSKVKQCALFSSIGFLDVFGGGWKMGGRGVLLLYLYKLLGLYVFECNC